MKHVRKHHFVILPLLAAGILAGWTMAHSNKNAGAVSPLCPSGSYALVDNNTQAMSQSYPLQLNPGPHQVSIYVPASMTSSIVNVYYTLDGEPNYIGKGIGSSSNVNWPMTWYSQVSPNGNHTVSATVMMNGGSCTIPSPSYVAVMNSTVMPLGLISTPAQFSGYTNTPMDFNMVSKTQNTTGGTAVDLTPWTMFQKAPVTVGAISPQDYSSSFHYFSGPSAGQGSIHVVGFYGGRQQPLDIPVYVYAQSTSTNTTTSSTTSSGGTTTTSPTGTTSTDTKSTSNTTTTSTSSSTSTTGSTPPPSVPTDSPIRTCIIAKITQLRFDAINSGQSRPTPAEFEAMQQCFAPQNFEVPSNFTTIPANKTIIKTQPVSNNVVVAAASTVTTKTNNTTTDALVFKGKAKPNTTVLLYLFSEPIVVSTSSNADGEWSYSLQDPMAPGKHEAYALVDKGDGNYERSNVFGFAIAKASAASSNPNGYSLKLEPNVGTATANNSATLLYVGGIAGLIVVVLAILGLVFVRRQKKSNGVGILGTPSPSATPIPVAPIAPPVASATPSETPVAPAPAPAAQPVQPQSAPTPTDNTTDQAL